YFLNFLKKYQKKIILVISKIDILKNKTAIDKIILSYTQEFDFDAVVPISSVNKQNLEILKDNVLSLLNEGKLLFPIETKTNITQEKLITELLREKFFFYLDKELPHVCRNVLEKTELTEAQVPNVINVLIFVPKINQKKILIGHNGENLKKIRIAAQRDIKKVLKMKINLKLWVKIDSDSLRKQNVSL
ncbi:KH domain-containing protein, partial ['Camptotheca acuminata' phytoplasma]|uniref:KH domain-containing protein n=1 Tax='Camptotheca acuminata' phytoplasma TaxID=3239192 RepID=UPI003519E274